MTSKRSIKPSAVSENPARKSAVAEDRHFVTALARGLEVLACFPSGEAQLGNQELAELCKLPKSTVSRLTMTLTRLGYLIQLPETRRYRLGMSTLALGSAMMSRLDVRQVARPLMQELAKLGGCSVALAARERLSMIYVELCRPQASLAISSDLGQRFPLLTSATGRAYLAVAAEEERRSILLGLHATGVGDQADMRVAVDKAVQEYESFGVSCALGTWQKDVNGIGRAFQPGCGLPSMAISCIGPSSRLSRTFLLKEVRPRLIELTQRLEATMPR
jgi:DNA-binding IclR family transcriptional regulator